MEIDGRLKKAPSCFMHLLEQEAKGIIIISSVFFLSSRSSAPTVEAQRWTDLWNQSSSDV